MNINEFYKVESDSLNVTLFHRNTGAKNWVPVGYYSNPRDCLEKMVKLEIMGTGLKDFSTVCKKVDELTALITTIKVLPHAVECLTDIPKAQKRGNGRAEATATA